MTYIERKKRNNVFSHHEALAEMLALRFKEGWPLRKLAKKYGVDHKCISQRCHTYALHTGSVVPKREREPRPVKIKIPKIKIPKAPKLPKPIKVRSIPPPRTEKPRMVTMFYIQQKEKEYRDETGDRINKGKSYKEYLKEQYPELSMATLRRRISGNDL